MRVLDSKAFNNRLPYDEDEFYNDDYYDDIPDEFSDTTSASGSRRGVGVGRSRRYSDDYGHSDDDYSDEDDSYRRSGSGGGVTDNCRIAMVDARHGKMTFMIPQVQAEDEITVM